MVETLFKKSFLKGATVMTQFGKVQKINDTSRCHYFVQKSGAIL